MSMLHGALSVAFVVYAFAGPGSSDLPTANSAAQARVEILATKGMPLRVDSAVVITVEGKATIKYHVTNISDQQITRASVWLALYTKRNASIVRNDLDQDRVEPGAEFEGSWQDDRLTTADGLFLFVGRAESKARLWVLDPNASRLLDQTSSDYANGNSYTIPQLKCRSSTKPVPDSKTAASETVDVRPQLLEQPTPVYTKEARQRKIEGTVKTRVLIGADGKPQRVTVVSGLPYGLNEQAIEAAYKMRFRPAMKDGKPVQYQVAVDIEFSIKKHRS